MNGFLCKLFIRYQLKGFLPHRFITVLSRLRLMPYCARSKDNTFTHSRSFLRYMLQVRTDIISQMLKYLHVNTIICGFPYKKNRTLNACNRCRSETTSCYCSQINDKKLITLDIAVNMWNGWGKNMGFRNNCNKPFCYKLNGFCCHKNAPASIWSFHICRMICLQHLFTKLPTTPILFAGFSSK